MKRLYSVYDVKSESYGPIFASPHDAVAIREFGAAFEHQQSALAKYPDEFELHCVGTFADAARQAGQPPVVGDVPMVVITGRAWVSARGEQVPLKLEA